MFPRLIGLTLREAARASQSIPQRTLAACALLVPLTLVGCSDDDGDGDAAGSASGSTSSSTGGSSSGNGGTGTGGSTSSPTCDADDSCQAFLDAHNAIRKAVNEGTYYGQPKADPPIPMMVWDPLIAEKAQEYADSVDDWSQGHSSSEFRTYQSTSYSGYHGENMAIGGGGYADPDYIVGTMWGADEAQGCQGSECGGHYTQIVWRDSVGLGCGTKENVTFGQGNTGTLTVCQYGPGGNFGNREPY